MKHTRRERGDGRWNQYEVEPQYQKEIESVRVLSLSQYETPKPAGGGIIFYQNTDEGKQVHALRVQAYIEKEQQRRETK